MYEILKRRGMDLVTVTDHDSIGAAERLRKFPDFFLSEEVSCTTPDGTQLHVGVYDISERDHAELQRRRDDLLSLIAYMRERRLLFSLNHVFSRLTGRRTAADFELFERHFPAVETRNGQMPARGNGAAARLAERWGKAVVAGSDSHTLGSLGLTYTAAPGARGKAEYLERVRLRAGVAEGEFGRYGKLTRAVAEIAMEPVSGEAVDGGSVAAAGGASGRHWLVNCLCWKTLSRGGGSAGWRRRMGLGFSPRGLSPWSG